MRMMYQKPAAVSLEETKEAVCIQLEKRGFASEYPYRGLAEAWDYLLQWTLTKPTIFQPQGTADP